MSQIIIPLTYKGVSNVNLNFQTYYKHLFNKCTSLFKFKNLPETINERFLLESLILSGKICWFEDNGNLYALDGEVGGEPNVYYEPQFFIVSNPIIGSKTLRIRNQDGSKDTKTLDGILMGLTDLDLTLIPVKNGGLSGLIYQTAGLLADNISSLNIAQINGRLSVAFTADTPALAATAEEVLQDIYEGKPYRVLSQDILNKIQATEIAAGGTNNTIMSLIEARAHILQDFYNEIGISAQGNLKRERINTAESELMTGSLDISIWNMIKNLREAVNEINERFNVNIEVEINPEVFYPDSNNATLGDSEEFQTDGIQEDSIKVSEPAEDSTEETEVKAEVKGE